jgi:hypothetical protein
MNSIFIAIFGLLNIIGFFGETQVVRIFALIGVLSTILQYIYVHIKMRESLQYILFVCLIKMKTTVISRSE